MVWDTAFTLQTEQHTVLGSKPVSRKIKFPFDSLDKLVLTCLHAKD